jgi:hypothetical protein
MLGTVSFTGANATGEVIEGSVKFAPQRLQYLSSPGIS